MVCLDCVDGQADVFGDVFDGHVAGGHGGPFGRAGVAPGGASRLDGGDGGDFAFTVVGGEVCEDFGSCGVGGGGGVGHDEEFGAGVVGDSVGVHVVLPCWC